MSFSFTNCYEFFFWSFFSENRCSYRMVHPLVVRDSQIYCDLTVCLIIKNLRRFSFTANTRAHAHAHTYIFSTSRYFLFLLFKYVFVLRSFDLYPGVLVYLLSHNISSHHVVTDFYPDLFLLCLIIIFSSQ